MAHCRSWPDRFVRRLRFLLLLICVRRLGQVGRAVLLAHVFAHFLNRLGRNPGGVGAHISDQANQTLFAEFTPSYKRCAIIMVRFTLKRSLREESCCNLLVVKGGAALRRRSFLSTDRTTQSACSSAARIFSASSPFVTSIFSSPLPRNRASNAGGLLAVRCASMVQYSFFSNALISRSRSTIKRRATVCTRPAESPRRTLSHSSGETWQPTSRSSTLRVCC